MDLNVQLFDKICRVCLVQCSELKSLFTKQEGEERSLLEILTFTANIDIKIEDNLPKQVCITCESIMYNADAFKRRCFESETILNAIIHRNASGYSEKSSTSENISLKDEKSSLKEKLIEHGTFISFVPTNNHCKSEFPEKNTEFQDFSISPSVDAYTKVTSSESNNTQTIKIEDINKFDDGNDFMDSSDNCSQTVITMEEQEKIKKQVPSKQDAQKKKIVMKYQCYCGVFFTNKTEYKIHLKDNKCQSFQVIKFGKGKDKFIKNPLYCHKCDLQLQSVYAYKIHRRKHNNDDTNLNDTTELFECTFCLRKFKNKNYLAAHIQKHEETDNVKHICEICKREFKYKAYLENHILTVHPNELTCDVCIQSFTDKDSLDEHKKIHENEKKHRCTQCNKAFYMLCTLKEHMRTHTGEKPFLCSLCGKGFSQKTNLGQHMRRHQGLKPFKCDTCEKRFVSKGELDAHIRKHSGAHPFICNDCGNGFTTSSALGKHRRIHTGERPYLCDLCPARFAASGTLKNHRRTHTGERPFQCSYCEKAFVQRNDLVSHIRCHTGERPYICTQCGQSFRKASALKTHLKLHIKDPIVGINALLTSMHCTKA